ncbi:HD domain-containing protein [Pseudonocardia sediminis]|uniref:HD domain-containing protein n=1 Tax=Pseudonocardia sediminis TaxID=1397368 RepID=UPI001028DC84|nr:HD domain-containing protein [Pseudonocardia sediminis]
MRGFEGLVDDAGVRGIERVRQVVAADFVDVDAAHDLAHLDRVARLAATIAHREGLDPHVAALAAYVHDYHRLEEARTGATVEPPECAHLVRSAFERAGIAEETWAPVPAAVDATGRFSFSDRFTEPAQGVAACLHDADMLDAMGAIGIARAFTYGGTIGEPIWEPGEDLASTYTSGRTSSVVAHFYEKLLHLRDELTTPSGRAMGEPRHRVLVEFLQRFHIEFGDGPPGRDPEGPVRPGGTPAAP